MQLKYRDDITWRDMPRIERPFFARSKLSADLSGPHPRISRFAFKNPLSEAYKRNSRDVDPVALKGLYQKIAIGHVMLVLTHKDDVFSPAFTWKEDPNHKDKGQWQLSQEVSSEAEFSYQLLLETVKMPGNRGSVKRAPSEPMFPGANIADTRRAIANTAIDTTNTVTDSYRKRELAEYADRYPQLNSGVSENPMEIEKLEYDNEAYGEFAGTIAGAVGMIGSKKPPKSLMGGEGIVKNKKTIRTPRDEAVKNVYAEAKARGVEIRSGQEADEWLDFAAAQQGIPAESMHATTLGDDLIYVREAYANNPRVIREELVHTTQQSRVQVGSGVDTRPALEIEAREELIKNRQEWGITNDEVREAINEIRQIRETGQY